MPLTTPIPATTSISQWNRATKHVEAAIRSGRYINAETALIFAGPPRISDMGGLNNLDQAVAAGGGAATGQATLGNDALYPVGLVEQFGVQQVQAVQKFYEIGSRRSYQSAGRVQVVGNIGRVLFNGPSLLRVLMAYYPNTIQMANGQRIGPGGDQDSVSRGIVGAGEAATQVFPPIYFEAGSKAGLDPEAETDRPHTFFGNLMSELFSHPFGIGVMMRDNRNRNYAAIYLEDCFITTHSWQISASSTLITEAVNFQADAAVPMEFSTLRGTQGAGPQIIPLNETNL